MRRTSTAIQALIILSALLGIGLLIEIRSMVPSYVFEIVATGEFLFVFDSVLTFISPRISYYLGLVLAILALASSLPQSAHWAFIENGLLIPSAIFIVGSALQVFIIILVVVYAIRDRKDSQTTRQGNQSTG